MIKCRWQRKVERWFDSESAEPDRIGRHVAACSTCSAHVEGLKVLRRSVKAAVVRQTVEEPQFGAFMEGIRQGIATPQRGHRGLWAIVSLTAASLIVATSVFFMVTGGYSNVAATEVESATTGIENATVEFYSSEDGSATVWVSEAGGEMW